MEKIIKLFNNQDGTYDVQQGKKGDWETGDYEVIGTLEFDKDQNAWVYDYGQDAVTYFDDLEETRATIEQEINNYDD